MIIMLAIMPQLIETPTAIPIELNKFVITVINTCLQYSIHINITFM